MKILLLVATERGRQFAAHMFKTLPNAQFTVCSFTETPHEPRYLDAIKELTESSGHTFVQSIRAHEISCDFDLLFAVSWRYMVPKSFYSKMRLGAYVFHDSVLPRYRGFAPTVWAMINREKRHGVTLLRMGEGVDEGDIVDQIGVQLGEHEYIGDVMPRLTRAYLDLVDRNINDIVAGNVITSPQNHDNATYGCKRTPEDARIDWTKSAADIYALIRASSRPYPGAYCHHESTRLTVWRAEPSPIRYEGFIPGRVVGVNGDWGIDVVCGDGYVLTLSEIVRDDRSTEYPYRLSDTLT
jgi:methionyl-tRNA formyltransferase